MSAPEPDWELLPGDPIAFFGLDPDFDRTSLKRAYTRLIRLYKPERHPEEFRRIREAYDSLDERLRYLGGTAEPGAGFSGTPAEWEHARGPASGAAPSIDLAALVAAKGAGRARTELRGARELDARGWCGLALLEEVLEESPLALCRALLDGIACTGGAPELVDLLRAVVHDGLPPAEAARLVQDMVVLVEGSTAPLPAHVYWFLTEPLWVDLVRRVEFDGFARLLEACTAKVGEAGRSGRLVLLTTLVRRAAFRAGDAWLEAAQRELGEAWLQLPPWLQEEVDVAEWLLRYRAERPAFRAAHELRETIDRALVAIVEGDEVRADRAFLAAQVACLDQRDELFEAFPFGARSGCAVEVLLWHADGALARRGGEREPEPAVHRVTEFSRRLVRRTDRSLTGQVRNLLLGILLFASVLLALSSFAVAAHLGAAERPLLWAIPAVTVVLALVAVLRGWFGRLVGRIEGPFVRRMHRLVWRRMTADFLAETHVPVQEVLRVIVAMKKRNANLDDYVEAVSGDEGLFLYSNAIRFAE